MLESALETALFRDNYTGKMCEGVLARDELPDRVPYPSCYIINTRPRTHNGEHWLALFYDQQGHADFFDSYGQHPSYFNLKSFLDKTSTSWSYNQKRIQGLSTHCGYYCLLYLFFRARMKSNKFFSFFTKNVLLNDKKVDHYIEMFKKK